MNKGGQPGKRKVESCSVGWQFFLPLLPLIFCIAYAITSHPSLPNQRPGVVTRCIKAQQRPHHVCRRFFMPADVSYGGCAWDALGRAGFLDTRFTTLRTAVTHSCGNECGSS